MDTSEIYIKMCDCPEIQDIRKTVPFSIYLEAGDFYVENNVVHIETFLVTSGDAILQSGGLHDSAKVVWLPRQDQLQDMLKEDDENYVEFRERIIYDFSARCHVLRMANDFRDYLSMEQLWFAFVMKEKFSKRWSGTEWV